MPRGTGMCEIIGMGTGTDMSSIIGTGTGYLSIGKVRYECTLFETISDHVPHAQSDRYA